MSSPKTAARLSRILAMLPWVIAHPGRTVDEVCERFGYERRQLIADLDLVFVCGLPGYGPGDLMVAYVEDDRVVVDTADYFSQAPRLSPAESLALLASGTAVLASGQGSEALASAVDKLARTLLPAGEEVLAIDLHAEPDLASKLRSAAGGGEVLEITYTTLSRGDTSVRHVEPWTVFTSLGNWYLSAFCRSAQAERVFRLDRIRRIRHTGESFDPPEHPPPPEVRYTPSEDDVRCVIELGPAAEWVRDYYPVRVLREGPPVTVEFSAYDALVAAGLLLRLGPTARLVEGAEVARELEGMRRALLARYSHRERDK